MSPLSTFVSSFVKKERMTKCNRKKKQKTGSFKELGVFLVQNSWVYTLPALKVQSCDLTNLLLLLLHLHSVCCVKFYEVQSAPWPSSQKELCRGHSSSALWSYPVGHQYPSTCHFLQPSLTVWTALSASPLMWLDGRVKTYLLDFISKSGMRWTHH